MLVEEQLLKVNPTQEKYWVGLVPRAPLRSSLNLGWDGIQVQTHRQPAWEMPKHLLTHHAIGVSHSRETIQVERVLGKQKQAEKVNNGAVIIIPANVQHKAAWDREGDITFLVLEPNQMTQTAQEIGMGDRIELIPHFAMVDPLIHQLGLALRSELESNQLSNHFYIDSLKTTLLAHLIKHYAVVKPTISMQPEGLSQYQLQRAIDYINDSLNQDIKLAEIAKVVGMSQYYFCRLFRQSTGIAPHQYLIQQRVERAKQLLKQRNVSIADVAFQCGFANQSHLTKMFRQLTGSTPKTYRNQYV